MHLDHDKFVDLLVETSGMDKEKVEKQLKQLLDEVNAAMAEGEAYEIEDFGVFMLLGNKINFVPSKGLETEINYKYAGMQPIDLSEEDGKTDGEEEAAEEDPFAFLETDEEESEGEREEQEQPGPEKWGIDNYKDEEGASNVFGALMGEEIEKEPEQSQETDAEEAESRKEESVEESLSDSKEEEKQPEDEVDDEDFDPFAIAGSEFKDSDEEEKPSEKPTEKTEEKKEKAAPSVKTEKKKPKDKVPVIKGVGTKGGEQKKTPETKSRPAASHSRTARNQSSPLLLIIVIIAVLGAVAFGAYQFGLFSSFEESEQVTQTSNPTPPVSDNNIENETDNPVLDSENADNITDTQNATTAATDVEQNNAPEEEQTQTTPTTNTVPITESDDADWGLTGQPQEMLNSGFTIVLYSLTDEENARSARNRLQNEGYRALVTPFNSSQYGNMWRVSIGQFRTIPDAAFAMDSVDEEYKSNYFITKIN